ncbi:hypothetical protein M3649_09095 [Ureibacillus chungkukjangi]|uniref:hypothetical protein n=1 Tax=Ureibacillus chungkukjangi TaxID=1202712 RepID=UPI00203D6B33|nr:hypothetical protein [Ureibacillus chungkukjangi]MCM3388288.1 hypothetical protein [Ureibacillus chungkukjangi]
MEFLIYVSLFISAVSFILGIAKLSWGYLLVSAITCFPLTYYYLGANNAWKYTGLIPWIVLLLLSVGFAIIKKKNNDVKNLGDFLRRI